MPKHDDIAAAAAAVVAVREVVVDTVPAEAAEQPADEGDSVAGSDWILDAVGVVVVVVVAAAAVGDLVLDGRADIPASELVVVVVAVAAAVVAAVEAVAAAAAEEEQPMIDCLFVEYSIHCS